MFSIWYHIRHYTTHHKLPTNYIEQSNNLASTYHMFEEISGISRRDEIIELHIKWIGWKDTDKSWKLLDNMPKDVPDMAKDSMPTAGDRNLKQTGLKLCYSLIIIVQNINS